MQCFSQAHELFNGLNIQCLVCQQIMINKKDCLCTAMGSGLRQTAPLILL